jgi:hypothetical protein
MPSGGARKGAGRKPALDKQRYKRVQVRLSQRLDGWSGKEVKQAAEWAVDNGYEREVGSED